LWIKAIEGPIPLSPSARELVGRLSRQRTMNDTRHIPTTTYCKADVLFIGYPKAASTYVHRFLESHPEVTIDHNHVTPLVRPQAIPGTLVVGDKPFPNKIHVSRDESIAESVCVIGELKNWQEYKYVPGAWDRVKDHIVVDPGEMALRLHKFHPCAKILVLIRDQSDWLQSAYKYSLSRLPSTQRTFVDYCNTPYGMVFLKAGHFDQTIAAYIKVFGNHRVKVLRFENIVSAPKQFAAELCSFIGISERPIPQRRENATHAQMVKIQRLFPLIERLPRGIKDAVKPHVMRLLPGGRGTILSSRDVRFLRCIYAASNQRTERLISQLSTQKSSTFACNTRI
jgi:hypothetical protein